MWSAGCSTGEEPYSLAMFLLDHFSAGNWDIEILASDISTRALARAESGTWPISKLAELPERYVTRYMLRGTGEYAGIMKAGPELQSSIRFQRLNLNTDALSTREIRPYLLLQRAYLFQCGLEEERARSYGRDIWDRPDT